jgi:hypothetical protein
MITPPSSFSSSNTPLNLRAEAHGTSVTFILVDMPPGQGERLRTYP